MKKETRIIKAWIRIQKGHPVKEATGQLEIYDKRKNTPNQWTIDHSDMVVPCVIKLCIK